MITIADLGVDGNWNGRSVDRKGQENDNLESRMDLIEHKRIVAEAAPLFLLGGGPVLIKGNKASEKLMMLYKACTSTSDLVVVISKGIHQPTYNPHIQLSITSPDYKFPVRYHLNTSAQDATYERINSGGDMLYQWKGVQFTAADGEENTPGYSFAAWPLKADITFKSNNSIRRRSICKSDLTDVREALKAAEENKKKGDIAKALKTEAKNITEAWGTFSKGSNFATFQKSNKGNILEELKNTGAGSINGKTFKYNKKSQTISWVAD